MTAQIDKENMNNAKSPMTDWDNDDDWDDWGDAEDNFPKDEKQDMIKPSNSTAEASEENCNNNSTLSDKRSRTQDTNHNNRTEVQQSPVSLQPHSPMYTSSWGSVWKPFGGVVSSVFSTASEGIGNFTTTVSHGLNHVIGVPDPEELARFSVAEEAKAKDAAQNNYTVIERDQKKAVPAAENTGYQTIAATPVFGLGLVSGVTTLGTKVLNSGLDTLEGIGKKTMDILQENDPLLMNKRKLLRLEPDNPNLSEILKEAKKDADELEMTLKAIKIEKSKELLRFDIIFENNCGLVHLEALEILSRESTLKIKSLLDDSAGNALVELQETLNEVKELIELEDMEGESDGLYDADELNKKLLTTIEDADLKISFDDIIKKWSQLLDWFSAEASNASEQEIYAKGMTALSESCALEINKLHKIAELLLVKEHHSTANEVDSIVQLCKEFIMHLSGLVNRIAATLSAKKTEEAEKQIRTLFEEMFVAVQQIEKAFKLFLPILQIGAV